MGLGREQTRRSRGARGTVRIAARTSVLVTRLPAANASARRCSGGFSRNARLLASIEDNPSSRLSCCARLIWALFGAVAAVRT